MRPVSTKGVATFGVVKAIVESPLQINGQTQYQYTIAYTVNHVVYWKQMMAGYYNVFEGQIVYVNARADKPQKCKAFLRTSVEQNEAMLCEAEYPELFSTPIPEEIGTSGMIRRGVLVFDALFLVAGICVMIIGIVVEADDKSVNLFVFLLGLLFAGVGATMIIREIMTDRQ